MTSLLTNGPLSEHVGFPHGYDLSSHLEEYDHGSWASVYFKGDRERCCLNFWNGRGGIKLLQASYYIGTDWIQPGILAAYVQPKLNTETRQTDYYKMLFEGLSNPAIGHFFEESIEIKTLEKEIELPHKLDILTPLLVIRYLYVLKAIVFRGLKRSYYPAANNLQGKIKGKILIGRQLKENIFKQRPTNTFCAYHEFGLDGTENRLLKKALLLATRYVNLFQQKENRASFNELLSIVRPAFAMVNDDIDVRLIKSVKVNSIYNEYKEALQLADLIFKRYGYNVNPTESFKTSVKVPPFWIDMSKLFELYVFAQLRKQEYFKFIQFQPQGNYGKPDFILSLPGEQAIIDAKYKPYYDERYLIDDIRQLSGYARDENILKALSLPCPPERAVADCIIIYPSFKDVGNNGLHLSQIRKEPIKQFTRFFKTVVELPLIENQP